MRAFFGEPGKRHLKQVAYVPQGDRSNWDFPVNVLDICHDGTLRRLGLFRRPKAHDREVTWACLEKEGAYDTLFIPIGRL